MIKSKLFKVIIFVLFGFFLLSSCTQNSSETKQPESAAPKKNEADSTTKTSPQPPPPAPTSSAKAELLDFDQAAYDAALKSDKLIVLYFYANWCPICKKEFPKMQEAFSEFETDKVIGFRVNYKDDETDENEVNLARQFGVSYQHTKVFIKNGERVLKSGESWDEEQYDREIGKFLE